MADDEYHRRTAITRLDVSPSAEELLRDTVDAWRDGCQLAVDAARESHESKTAVQRLAYDTVRERTELGSKHAVLATHQAAEVIASCNCRRKRGKDVSKPEFTAPTVTYDARTMTLFEDGTVSLTTTAKRVRCELVLPEDGDGYHYRYLDDDQWELTQSTLHYRDGDWYLHAGFRKRKTESPKTTENGTVLGVDLGVEQLAVASTARFFDAGERNHRRREYAETRGGLQQQGTRSARRTLRSAVGGKTST